jgi:hypothetical protein
LDKHTSFLFYGLITAVNSFKIKTLVDGKVLLEFTTAKG